MGAGGGVRESSARDEASASLRVGSLGARSESNYAENRRERILPVGIRTDRSLPAFTNCSLDNDIGTAIRKPSEQLEKERKGIQDYNRTRRRKKTLDPYDGDPPGQINLYLYWETGDILDTESRWEMTVGLIGTAPENLCTVDITPRRCQRFKPEPGEKLLWSNLSLKTGKELQKGEVVGDKWGLVTLRALGIPKAKHRIKLRRR